jgi:hypothetical protein
MAMARRGKERGEAISAGAQDGEVRRLVKTYGSWIEAMDTQRIKTLAFAFLPQTQRKRSGGNDKPGSRTTLDPRPSRRRPYRCLVD